MEFSKMTMPQLKAFCKENDITFKSNIRKNKLLQLVHEYSTDVTVTISTDDEKEEQEEKKEQVEEMSTNVLELCKIPDSLNIEQMKELIKGYMEPRTEFYRSTHRPCLYEDEFSEYHTAISTGGITIGGGSCGMDVKTRMNEGIDAMCVIMNNAQSNEKSLMQNFSESGEDLDHLFHKKDDTTAVNQFVEGYSKKLLKCKKEKDLNDLYILSFISTHTEVYLACFKINIENLKNVSSGGFINKIKDKCVNIIVNNFINSTYGNVHLYKSKKRMELRLHRAILKHAYTVKIYNMESPSE
jgi:hypothetical protein